MPDRRAGLIAALFAVGGIVLAGHIAELSPYGLPSVLSFQSPYWAISLDYGAAGLTLWMILIASLAVKPDRRLAGWTAAVAVVAFLSSWPSETGVATRAGVPIAASAIAACRALRADDGLLTSARLTFAATLAGVLLGSDVAWLLFRPELLTGGVIGGAGLLDALFLVPVLATAWVVGWRIVRTRFTVRETHQSPLLRHSTRRETLAWGLLGIACGAPLWAVGA